MTLGDWRSIGPRNFGGKVYDIAIDPTNPKVVYAAYGQQGGLWKTSDGGASWQRAVDPMQYNSFVAVAIAPTNPSIVVTGLGAPDPLYPDHGILRSSDAGLTWSPIGPTDGTSLGFYRIIIDPIDVNVIYAATENQVYKTTDGGSSWRSLLTYTGTFGNFDDLPDLVMSPSDHNTLLLGQESVGIRRTTDGGSTWTDVDPAPMRPAPTILAFASSNSGIVYAERPSGKPTTAVQTFRSSDGGQTWKATATITYFHQGRYDESMVVDPLDSNHVFVANSYLFESKDGAASFSRVNNFGHGDYLRILYALNDNTTLLSGNDGGVWRSTDGGTNWSRFDSGAETTISFGVAVDPVTGEIIMSPADYGCTHYTGDSDHWGLFYGGEWSEFYISPHDRNVIFTRAAGVLQRSTDGGATWVNTDPEAGGPRPYSFPFAFDARDPNTVYVSTKRLYKSTDLGQTWSVISPAAFDAMPYYIDSFAVADTNPAVIYALSGTFGLWQSSDNGVTWIRLNDGAGKTTLTIAPSSSSTIYVGGYGGLQICANYGASCSNASGNLGSIYVRQIVFDPASPSRIFIATDEGVFTSTDGGSSWMRLGARFPPIRVWHLSVLDHHIYAGSGQSVWEFSRTTTAAATIQSYLATTAYVVPYAASTLSWNSYNGAASISNVGAVPSFGSLDVHPAVSGVYTLFVDAGTSRASAETTITVDQSSVVTMQPRDFSTGNWRFEELLSDGSTIPLVYHPSLTTSSGDITTIGPGWFVSSGYGFVQLDTTREIVLLHPQGNNGQIAATYFVSATGTYRITGGFTRYNDSICAGDGVVASVIKNSDLAHPLYRTAIPPCEPVNVYAVFKDARHWFDISVGLVAGDAIRFLVSAGPANDISFDATAFEAAITEVPPRRRVVRH